MHYFFLEKQSNLTLRWKVRQVAFDAKYRYLYYSKPLSRTDIEEVMTRSQEVEGAVAAATGNSGSSSPILSGGTSSRKVKWSGKVKVTQLRYAADEYIVPPTSDDFNEGVLLTLIIIGYERSLVHRPHRGKGSVGNSSENSFSHRSNASWFRSTSWLSTTRMDSEPDADAEDEAPTASAGQPLLTNADTDVPAPESPSGFIHMPSYPVNESLDEDFEDEDENMFRDIDLAPDDEEDEETSVAASEAETEASDEDAEEEADEDDVALNSPPSSPTESVQSGYSFFSRRRRVVRVGAGTTVKDEKAVQLQFRAANYDVFRIVSLRVRQALVRHGLCGPLHAGLPPYDPRNGIALATVPLHLRHAFRRLNDVVFYSLQIGHVVYVRQQREVRGMEGYLCITHDSILLLQLDGKCPRWLDLEDIVGVQYVLRGNHSFISIRAAEPYPDFVFIPIIPSYPPNSTFDSEECVEGIVSMVRRLLMQRLRAGEEVALAPVSSRRASVHTAEDTDEYDVLCHIHDLSAQHTDVFKYIAQEQSTGATPLRWRWDNSKTPTHFTFKRDLYQALERDEGEDTDDDEEASPSRMQRRPFMAPASHAQMGEAVVPSRQQQHLSMGQSAGSPLKATSTSRWPERGAGPHSAVSSSYGVTPPRAGALSPASSMYSNASFMPATMTQLMAPPSRGAELRAKQRLQVTRTDRRNASPAGAVDTSVSPAAAGGSGGGFGESVSASVGGAGAGGTVQPPPQPQPMKTSITTSSMGTIPYVKPSAAAPQSDAPPRIYVSAAPSSSSSRQRSADTRPPSQAASAVVTATTAATINKRAAAHLPLHSTPGTTGQRSPEPPGDSDSGSSPNTVVGSAPSQQRPPSSRPNTYGLVPSQLHADPTVLDYWLSSAAPNVPPVATAPKGVHLSEIHVSMQQQQQQQQTTTSGHDLPSPCPSSTHSGKPADAPAAATTTNAPGTAYLGHPPTPAASNGGNGVGNGSLTANAGSAVLVPSASMSSRGGAGAASGSSTRGGQPSSAGPQESVTNGSRSPQEVTHTTENASEGGDVVDEESDEDFDSEDMEDMLQRPESRGQPTTHEHAALPSLAISTTTGGLAASASASASTAVAAAGIGGTPGAGTVPVESPGFVKVAEGVVTPTVLTADLLPGFRPREADRQSEKASAPSPSLQARPDMAAFIPPAVLPK
ncbi:hypothetical protein ABB37_09146 [Leptomonas pyrrhocoris]|uniref:Uncharacterized protein n=1 Tax=Leptomonas pyrrhocoris TaxID=157538 RepID=A0A0M9FRE6_LEPPY|nr:hypothetical protein ABB37_09146 [Leptomonas pyrrhocoris]KPA74467.1 hypothetical protein ABB37_09146 [Leptomonas pyrrhocoris]|eukprot:XP_015652906.1 hypothetical protein ABB37_09146 [Leptomonas pyrrhocoris]